MTTCLLCFVPSLEVWVWVILQPVFVFLNKRVSMYKVGKDSFSNSDMDLVFQHVCTAATLLLIVSLNGFTQDFLIVVLYCM